MNALSSAHHLQNVAHHLQDTTHVERDVMAIESPTHLLRQLPQIEEVLEQPALDALKKQLPHSVLADAARSSVNEARQAILAGESPDVSAKTIATNASRQALTLCKPSLRRVINASGVIVHTNLGRSVLAQKAIDAVDRVISGYSNVEYDTRTGSRGSRHDHCEQLICALTGAESAIAVNNNAAAVMMVLHEFARGHKAIVSRGELVEIGGSFRIPDIMQLSNAHMVEVGTTNKTHESDYRNAVDNDCAMLLKVHPSNYRMIGFTEDVSIAQLRTIADETIAQRDDHAPVLVYEDQGSGALIHLDCFGEGGEPTVAESIQHGADLVSFSADKLLGGPQAGIIVGSKTLIDRLKRNPLARVVRLDKMTLAALEATLRLYLDPRISSTSVPTLRMLDEDPALVHDRADALDKRLKELIPKGCIHTDIVPEISRAGGGSLPMCDIPTFALSIAFDHGDAQSCEHYLTADNLIPIVVRIKHEKVLCDMRTVLNDEEIDMIARGFAAYFDSIGYQTCTDRSAHASRNTAQASTMKHHTVQGAHHGN